MKFPPHNYLKISLICGSAFAFGLLYAYIIFPPILKAILRSQVILKPGTQMRDMYDALPFPLIFKVYLFNVLNPDDVMQGMKPNLQEVGPFVFDEWKVKVNQTQDIDADTIEFTEKKTFYFNQELSGNLSGNEIVTIIHPLILGAILSVNIDRPHLLPIITKAINVIFKNPSDIFWTGRAMDIMFRGIEVDCTSRDFNARAVCDVFKSGEVAQVRLSDVEDKLTFSMFNTENGTDGGRFKTYRGMKKLSDLGRVIEYNGHPTLTTWSGDECNAIRGTESSIFPPFKDKKEGIWAFESAVCRSLKTVYLKSSRYGGLPTSRHTVDFGDSTLDERLKCFCTNNKCPLRGTLNLYPCTKSPVIGSLPHFYEAEPSLLDAIESGLHPDKDKHNVFIDMEPISGTPLQAAKRLQINMELLPLKSFPIMANLSSIAFPIGWVEEGVALNKTYVNMLKYQLFLALKCKAIVKWFCLIVGSIGCIGGAIGHITQKKKIGNNIQDLCTSSSQVTTVSSSALVLSSGNSDISNNNAKSDESNYIILQSSASKN